MEKFIFEKNQDFDSMDEKEQEELLNLFKNAPDDFKNLILGQYGRLPAGWPANWIYKSTFEGEWEEKIKSRND